MYLVCMGIRGRKGVGVINVQLLVLIIGLIFIVNGFLGASVMIEHSLGR